MEWTWGEIFAILTVVLMLIHVVSDIMSYQLVDSYNCFREELCFHLQCNKLLNYEDGDMMFLENTGNYLPVNMV